jgi:hypothetical protein
MAIMLVSASTADTELVSLIPTDTLVNSKLRTTSLLIKLRLRAYPFLYL